MAIGFGGLLHRKIGGPRIRGESLDSDGEDHFQESDERETAINRSRQDQSTAKKRLTLF
jgi:hypothetical protein